MYKTCLQSQKKCYPKKKKLVKNTRAHVSRIVRFAAPLGIENNKTFSEKGFFLINKNPVDSFRFAHTQLARIPTLYSLRHRTAHCSVNSLLTLLYHRVHVDWINT